MMAGYFQITTIFIRKNKLTNEAENCLVNSSTATLNRAFAPVLEVFTFILCVTSEASDLNILKITEFIFVTKQRFRTKIFINKFQLLLRITGIHGRIAGSFKTIL